MPWIWCLHCRRAFRDDQYRYAGDYHRCAYEDCPGLAPFDMIDWREIRLLSPEYPEVPTPGQVYLLPTPIP